jgi:hypothetical protein
MVSTTPANSLNAAEVLDGEFLELRARLLQVAAQLDRIHRAAGAVSDHPRMKAVHQVLAVLASSAPDRAEQLQMIFSRPYDAQWQTKMEISPR